MLKLTDGVKTVLGKLITIGAGLTIGEDSNGLPTLTGAAVRHCRTTSAQVLSANTFGNVTDLAFPVVAGQAYHFRFLITFQSASATNGVVFATTHPATTFYRAMVSVLGTVAQNTAGSFGSYSMTTADTGTGTIEVGAANTDYVAVVEGLLLPSASGTLQLRARSEVNAVNLTIQATSFGLLMPVVA